MQARCRPDRSDWDTSSRCFRSKPTHSSGMNSSRCAGSGRGPHDQHTTASGRDDAALLGSGGGGEHKLPRATETGRRRRRLSGRSTGAPSPLVPAGPGATQGRGSASFCGGAAPDREDAGPRPPPFRKLRAGCPDCRARQVDRRPFLQSHLARVTSPTTAPCRTSSGGTPRSAQSSSPISCKRFRSTFQTVCPRSSRSGRWVWTSSYSAASL